ncbi:MAG TPA: hypothetical protein PLX97_08020, partial [Gemmatales bacterium]|nr:hypothetical protein [Gemmatales bacterium]
MKQRWILAGLFVLVVLAAIVYWRLLATSPTQRQSAETVVSQVSQPAPGSEEEKTRMAVLGVWQDNYQGKRTMTLHKDGTGTMLVELEGAAALLYASQLRFDMTWSLEGKKLTKKTVGGEPAAKVNLILNTLGDTAVDTIMEMTEDRLLLLDQN